MSNFAQKNFVTSAGKEFVFQFPGVRQVTKITDRIKNKFGIPSDESLAVEMLTNVVVQPKMKVEDFEGPAGYKELGEVVNAAYLFITGNDDESGEENGEDQ